MWVECIPVEMTVMQPEKHKIWRGAVPVKKKKGAEGKTFAPFFVNMKSDVMYSPARLPEEENLSACGKRSGLEPVKIYAAARNCPAAVTSIPCVRV